MNIHDYKKDIRDLLLTGNRESQSKDGKKTRKPATYFPGVYIISRVLNGVMKLGEAHGAGGLYSRITSQYKICYPVKGKEFFMRYIVICHREKEMVMGSRKKMVNKHFSQIMEAAMLKIIKSEIEDSYSREYIFAPDIAELDRKMVTLLKSHRKYFSTAIKFGDKLMHVFNGNGFNTTKDFDVLKSLNPHAQSLLDLYTSGPKSIEAALVALKNSKPRDSPRKTKPQAAQPKMKIEKKAKTKAQSQRSQRTIRKPKRYL